MPGPAMLHDQVFLLLLMFRATENLVIAMALETLFSGSGSKFCQEKGQVTIKD